MPAGLWHSMERCWKVGFPTAAILGAPMTARSLGMRLPVFPRPLALLLAATLTACGSNPPGPHPTVAHTTATATPAPPIKIGIALGGGAAKGFAHIGVIKMLEANGFAPAVVAGTSAGSVVGAL